MKRINRIISILLAVCVMLSIAAFNGVTVDAADNSSISANNQLIGCGGYHSAAIKKDGSLWLWGNNSYGQLGDGTTTDELIPKKTMEDAISVSLGYDHSAVIKKDGSLWLWGANWSGQIGDGATDNVLKPKKILDDVVSVSLGAQHSAAIKKDGSLYLWGDNQFGQIGDGTTDNVSKPKKILDDVVNVEVGYEHSAAIKKDGSLWLWGHNSDSQIGDGTRKNALKPKKILDDVVSVSLGGGHSAAIKKDGSLWLWGWNERGQIGDGTTTDVSKPKKILDDVVSVSLGACHSAVVDKHSCLYVWGWNERGRIGDGTTTDVLQPVFIQDGFVSVCLGESHSIAISDDGSLHLWGSNLFGNIGDGTTNVVRTPKEIMPAGSIQVETSAISDGSVGEALSFEQSSYQATSGISVRIKATYSGTKDISASDLAWSVNNTKDPSAKNPIQFSNIKVVKNEDVWRINKQYDISADINSSKDGTYIVSLSLTNGPSAETSVEISQISDGYSVKDGWPIKNSAAIFGYDSDYTIPFERYGIFTSYSTIRSNYSAAAIYNHESRFGWTGSCFGMSLLSATNYLGLSNLKGYFPGNNGDTLSEYGYTNTILQDGKNALAVSDSPEVVETIERAHISQFSNEFCDTEVFKNDDTYSQLLNFLKTAKEPIIVNLEGYYRSGDDEETDAGHTVVIDTTYKPISMKDNKSWGEDWYCLKVYDPNAPQKNKNLSNAASWYGRESFLFLNTKDGAWRMYCYDADGNTQYWMGKAFRTKLGHRYISFFKPSLLKKSYFTNNLHCSYLRQSFSAEDIVFTKDTNDLLKIEKNELVGKSSAIDYIAECSVNDERNKKNAVKYANIGGDQICYSSPAAEVELNSDDFTKSFLVSTEGQCSVQTTYKNQSIEISAEDTVKASVLVGYENKMIAVKDEIIKKGSKIKVLVVDDEIEIDLDGNALGTVEIYQNGKKINYEKKTEKNSDSNNATIEPEFDKEDINSKSSDSIQNLFSDVSSGKWYTDAVYYCRDKGYMAGKANNKFDPNGKVTRATITQVLYAMEGKPAVKKSAGFKDLKVGAWYVDSVNWAASIGIVAGYSKDKFGPNDPITRQQMAAIMYQYAKYKKYDTAANGDISKFKDSGSITKYAITPMKWAVGHGIISGTNKGLEPKGTATRAQIAVILQAFDKNIKK